MTSVKQCRRGVWEMATKRCDDCFYFRSPFCGAGRWLMRICINEKSSHYRHALGDGHPACRYWKKRNEK